MSGARLLVLLLGAHGLPGSSTLLGALAARCSGSLRKVAALTAPCRGSCSAAAASTIPEATYTAASSNTFIFFSTPKTQAAAEAECMKKGGHLASYQNGAEQDEVEQYFVRKVC